MKSWMAFCLIGCLLLLPLSVSAADVATADGLEVTVTPDEDTYDVGEEILLSITLTNSGKDTLVNLSLDTLLPPGMDYRYGDLHVENITIGAGQTYQTTVTAFVEDKGTVSVDATTTVTEDVTQATQTPDTQTTGSSAPTTSAQPTEAPEAPETPADTQVESAKEAPSFPIVWVIVGAAAVVAAVVLLVVFRRKLFPNLFCLFLCVAVLAALMPSLPLAVEGAQPTAVTVKKRIAVGSVNYTVQFTVRYEVIAYREPTTEEKVADLLQTKHKLTYNADGSFRVLIIADAHMDAKADATEVQEIKDRIRYLVDSEQPNLVIFTGDNTIHSYSTASLRNSLDAIVGYVEEKQIPWCHVYGNHDEEYGMKKEDQQDVYESYQYCVSKSGPEGIYGVGNYALGVYRADGSLGSVIYCLDSGDYAEDGGYDYIKEDQIAWYKSASQLLQQYNGGKVVPALMAFHIPLYENRIAYEKREDKTVVREWNGQRNEDICSSKTDVTNMFETILERGDVKAVVTGHDHINDYMFNYYGVKLCNSPNVSDLIYHDPRMQGGRVFDLNEDTLEDIPTHVTYIIPRN